MCLHVRKLLSNCYHTFLDSVDNYIASWFSIIFRQEEKENFVENGYAFYLYTKFSLAELLKFI